jgi:DNA (cytosine-5)-methyltransferase 1
VWPRVLTVREAARIHSYPDWFRFHVTKWHGFRQIGNSVPPMLGRAVASAVIRALGVNPTKPRRAVRLVEAQMLRLDMSEACRFLGVPFSTIPQRNRPKESRHTRRANGSSDLQPELALVDAV